MRYFRIGLYCFGNSMIWLSIVFLVALLSGDSHNPTKTFEEGVLAALVGIALMISAMNAQVFEKSTSS